MTGNAGDLPIVAGQAYRDRPDTTESPHRSGALRGLEPNPVLTVQADADRDASPGEVASALVDLARRMNVNVRATVDSVTMTASPDDDAESVSVRHEMKVAESRRFRA